MQFKTNQSDREMEGSTHFNARYKYAMGAPQDYTGIDAVTLCDHRNLFFENNTTMKIFEKVLSIAAEEGFFEDEHLNVIDSFMVERYSAKQSTYQMIYLAIKRTLKIIKMQGIKLPYFELIRSDYEENIKKPEIDWSLKEEKENLLDDLVKDAKAILKALENSGKFNKNSEIKRSYELLKKVSTQDVKKNQNGKYEMIRGTAKDRTISINDPEMRHGHKTTSKKSDGYKCEIITGGEKGKYILATRVFPANVPDGTYMGELIDQIKEYDLDLDVKVLLGDTAYCDFEEIERLEKE
ncbi:MAG: transposase, partial [Bacillota bacterium]|nr:transposase [Bacillota bacterium]